MLPVSAPYVYFNLVICQGERARRRARAPRQRGLCSAPSRPRSRRRRILRIDAQAVDHVTHAGQAFDQIFGMTLLRTRRHSARQDHFTIAHGDFDIGGVYMVIVGEALTHLP